MEKKFESLNHEWEIETDSGEDWDGMDSAKLTISGVEVAEINGMNSSGCLDEEDDPEMYKNAKEDLQFVSRLLANAPKMMLAIKEFCDRVDKGEIRSKKTYAKFKSILEELGVRN